MFVFGMQLQVVSETSFVKSCAKNSKNFVNSTLKKGKNTISPVVMRCLQFMSINWLHQHMLICLQHNLPKLRAQAHATDLSGNCLSTLDFLEGKLFPHVLQGRSILDFPTLAFQQELQCQILQDYFAKVVIMNSKPKKEMIRHSSVEEHDLTARADSIQCRQNSESFHRRLGELEGKLLHLADHAKVCVFLSCKFFSSNFLTLPN